MARARSSARLRQLLFQNLGVGEELFFVLLVIGFWRLVQQIQRWQLVGLAFGRSRRGEAIFLGGRLLRLDDLRRPAAFLFLVRLGLSGGELAAQFIGLFLFLLDLLVGLRFRLPGRFRGSRRNFAFAARRALQQTGQPAGCRSQGGAQAQHGTAQSDAGRGCEQDQQRSDGDQIGAEDVHIAEHKIGHRRSDHAAGADGRSPLLRVRGLIHRIDQTGQRPQEDHQSQQVQGPPDQDRGAGPQEPVQTPQQEHQGNDVAEVAERQDQGRGQHLSHRTDQVPGPLAEPVAGEKIIFLRDVGEQTEKDQHGKSHQQNPQDLVLPLTGEVVHEGHRSSSSSGKGLQYRQQNCHFGIYFGLLRYETDPSLSREKRRPELPVRFLSRRDQKKLDTKVVLIVYIAPLFRDFAIRVRAARRLGWPWSRLTVRVWYGPWWDWEDERCAAPSVFH